jgi:hypothetical protein
MNFGRVVGCAAFLLVSGCATQALNERGVGSSDVAALRQSGVRATVGTDVPLKEQTKTKVVAARTLQLLAGILGGGAQVSGGQRNPPPVDGYTVTEGHATVFDAKEANSFEGPVAAMAKALDRKLERDGVPVGVTSDYWLSIVPMFWGVDYEKLSEKDDYRLYYRLNVKLMHGDKAVGSYECMGATQEMHALDDWLAEDRALVKKDAALIGDICADKTLTAFQIEPAVTGSIGAWQP